MHTLCNYKIILEQPNMSSIYKVIGYPLKSVKLKKHKDRLWNTSNLKEKEGKEQLNVPINTGLENKQNYCEFVLM